MWDLPRDGKRRLLLWTVIHGVSSFKAYRLRILTQIDILLNLVGYIFRSTMTTLSWKSGCFAGSTIWIRMAKLPPWLFSLSWVYFGWQTSVVAFLHCASIRHQYWNIFLGTQLVIDLIAVQIIEVLLLQSLSLVHVGTLDTLWIVISKLTECWWWRTAVVRVSIRLAWQTISAVLRGKCVSRSSYESLISTYAICFRRGALIRDFAPTVTTCTAVVVVHSGLLLVLELPLILLLFFFYLVFELEDFGKFELLPWTNIHVLL